MILDVNAITTASVRTDFVDHAKKPHETKSLPDSLVAWLHDDIIFLFTHVVKQKIMYPLHKL